jgi:hypothetical protein
MKPGFIAWFIVCSLTLTGCASAPEQPADTPSAQAAIDAAAKVLAEADSLDSVWVVWDPGMPASADAPTLNEILDAARKKQEAGDIAEATRMAEVVAEFARLGVEQAKRNQTEGIPPLR